MLSLAFAIAGFILLSSAFPMNFGLWCIAQSKGESAVPAQSGDRIGGKSDVKGVTVDNREGVTIVTNPEISAVNPPLSLTPSASKAVF